MKNRVKLPDYNALWSEALKREDGTLAERLMDDGTERAFWCNFMSRKSGYAPDAPSRLIVRKLLPLLEEHNIQTALELGPGWGNYTLDLAGCCRSVTCVDISPDVLEFILRISQENGYDNIFTINAKWEEFEPERLYDLVFGYNCFYRLPDLKSCIEKMDRSAAKLCVMGMSTGIEPAWFFDMEREMGVQVHWDNKDYIYFINILYSMGTDPELYIIPFEKILRYIDQEEMVRSECKRLADGYDAEMVAGILMRYFTRQPDGSLQAAQKLRGALVYWRPTLKCHID